jgi:hypothetical protein
VIYFARDYRRIAGRIHAQKFNGIQNNLVQRGIFAFRRRVKTRTYFVTVKTAVSLVSGAQRLPKK